MTDKEYKIIPVRVSREWFESEYKEFKKLLIDKGKSLSQWVRDKIEEELNRNK